MSKPKTVRVSFEYSESRLHPGVVGYWAWRLRAVVMTQPIKVERLPEKRKKARA